MEKKRTDDMVEQKKARNFPAVSHCFLAKLNKSWFKVSTAQHRVNEGAQFSENVSLLKYDIDLIIAQKSF